MVPAAMQEPVTAPDAPRRVPRTDERLTRLGGPAVLAAILAGLWYLYGIHGNMQEVEYRGHSAIRWMVERWSGSGGDLSHGWLIPVVSAWLVWRRRVELRAAPRHISYAGLAVVILALVLHWAGIRAQLTRVSLLSLAGLLWGIPLYLYGRRVAGLLLFPCAYLLFCIPLSFLNDMTVPLRLVASEAATALLNGLGIAAVRTGTIIRSAAGGGFNLDIADPCSGLRSLLAMTALTAVYAYVTQETQGRRWVLFLAAVPLAMAGNVARILTIALVAQRWGQDAAVRVYHDYSGLIVFVVAILLMVGFGELLKTDFKQRMRGWTGNASSTASS
jgi:exosortase